MVMGEFTQETDVLVVGGGPGGYAAAFRAADLGLDVTMVDLDARPGGVCLFRGCIPSKTLLYAAEILHDARRAEEMGILFGEPKVDLGRLREWKDKVVDKLAAGLVELSRKRGVQLIQGSAVFESSDHVRVMGTEASHIRFKHAVIATGSHSRINQAVEQRLGTLRKAVGAEAHVHLDFFPVGVVQKRKALIGNPAAALVAGMEQVVGLLPADFPQEPAVALRHVDIVL